MAETLSVQSVCKNCALCLGQLHGVSSQASHTRRVTLPAVCTRIFFQLLSLFLKYGKRHVYMVQYLSIPRTDIMCKSIKTLACFICTAHTHTHMVFFRQGLGESCLSKTESLRLIQYIQYSIIQYRTVQCGAHAFSSSISLN